LQGESFVNAVRDEGANGVQVLSGPRLLNLGKCVGDALAECAFVELRIVLANGGDDGVFGLLVDHLAAAPHYAGLVDVGSVPATGDEHDRDNDDHGNADLRLVDTQSDQQIDGITTDASSSTAAPAATSTPAVEPFSTAGASQDHGRQNQQERCRQYDCEHTTAQHGRREKASSIINWISTTHDAPIHFRAGSSIWGAEMSMRKKAMFYSEGGKPSGGSKMD
jgi:hypothetical protein